MVSVSILSNLYKIKYSTLNASFQHSPNAIKRKRYLMVIDIGKIINMILKIIAKKDIMITNKIKTQVIISTLNIIAHYRHYFHDTLKGSNSFILYCEDPRHYDEYEEIIQDIYNICRFIPSIIVIPKMKGKVSRYFYIHTVCYIIETNSRISKRSQKDMVTLVYGNNPIEYQFANITDNIYFVSNNCDTKVRSLPEMWENILDKDPRFHNVKYQYELKHLLLPYMIYFHKLNIEKYQIMFVSHSKFTSRINTIFDYIDNFRNPNEEFYISYGKNLDIMTEDIKKCGRALNEILYSNNVKVKPFIADFVKSISQKLHDKKMDNINEYNEIMNKNNIHIMWLREDKGL
ncbi:MAG: hypothetical protein ACRC5M_06790 [Anaeroplasmataceae bacterium]